MTEAQTLTLTDFLLARISDDQAIAEAAAVRTRPLGGPEPGSATETANVIAAVGMAASEHIRTWSPDRVLAECEAKRWLVNWLAGELADDPDCVMENEALHALAAPYSGHPDFRDEWRVG